MVRLAAIALLFATACASSTPKVRVFGAAGTEQQSTPTRLASPLNPGNAGRIEPSRTLGDLTAYANVAPESRRWKAHAKVRASVIDGNADLDVGEASLQWSASGWLDVTAGRVIEKWGSGYAWNPTSFLGPRKNPSDPNDRLATYRGADLVRVDAYAHGATLSMFAVSGGTKAVRASTMVGGADVSVALARDGDSTQQGVSFARVFGDALELHGEAARRRVVLGGQYTWRGGTNLIVELYRSGDGLTAGEWRTFREDVSRARTAEAFLTLNAQYRPMQMGRNYGFVRLYVPWQSQRTDFEVIAIPSLRDGSAVVRLSASRALFRSLDVYVIDTEFAGRHASEFSYVQIERVTAAGVRLHF